MCTDEQKSIRDGTALIYFSSHDPIQAYVKAGYVKNIEEAKKSKNYTKPLHSKGVQIYLAYFNKSYRTYKLCLKVKRKELFIQASKSYKDSSKLGINAKDLLLDIIDSPYCSVRDRLEALEFYLKNYLKLSPSNQSIVILDNLQRDPL